MDATDWDTKYAAAPLWSADPNCFVQTLADLPPGRAADLACGQGRHAIWLARRGWQVTGVDFSEVALGRAREHAAESGVQVDWVRQDLLGWTGQDLDLVVIAYLHLPAAQRRQVVRQAFEALTPGGTFFLAAHHLRNITEGTGGPKHLEVACDERDVLADLDGLAFEVVRAATAGRDCDGGVRAIDFVVRLVKR